MNPTASTTLHRRLPPGGRTGQTVPTAPGVGPFGDAAEGPGDGHDE